MTDSEFMQDVRRRARLESARDAEIAAVAVLTRIAGRVSWRRQRDLGADLPPRIRRRVLAAANTDLGYAPSEAFLRDLAEDLSTTRAQAADIAAAVGDALGGLLSSDVLLGLKAELHGTYDVVFKNRAA